MVILPHVEPHTGQGLSHALLRVHGGDARDGSVPTRTPGLLTPGAAELPGPEHRVVLFQPNVVGELL